MEVVEPGWEGGGRVGACLGGGGREKDGSRGRELGSLVAARRRLPSSAPGRLSSQRWDRLDLCRVDRCRGQILRRGDGVMVAGRRGSRARRARRPGSPVPWPSWPWKWGGEVASMWVAWLAWPVGRGSW